jgi:transcriptional regulator GlxA family with amidase domain
MRSVAILAFDGVVAVDLVLPAETFGQMRLPDGRAGYRVKVCGVVPSVESSVCRMLVPHGLSALRSAETIIVPGIDRPERHVDERLLEVLRRAAARGVRIASVCSGALVLARTGLLDGKRATTHWAAANALRALHPRIEVDESVLYIDNGRLLTSAGGMAQLDLCLHMIRNDYGAAAAADSARLAVMPLERHGGQAQYIVHTPPAPERRDSLSETLEWMQRHLGADLTVTVLARRAAMSERTFARRFRQQTGTTPAKWVTRARIARAQTLLETTALSVENVAEAAGFGSPVAFRERFKDIVGVAPFEYRKTFSGETRG